jgi:hypothetical protein
LFLIKPIFLGGDFTMGYILMGRLVDVPTVLEIGSTSILATEVESGLGHHKVQRKTTAPSAIIEIWQWQEV